MANKDCQKNALIKTELRKETHMSKEIPYKIYLDEKDIPSAWYNMRADMKISRHRF